jgi:bifunctional DNA-binding transcriptional regulator/antitoxin component of YhaV-PrlF toxin-antitoxin module
MVRVQFSNHNELILPDTLGRALGLHEGDRVEVRRQDNTLCLRRCDPAHLLGPLTDLARIISSSRPPGSVDIDALMDKHGYEQVKERPNLRP